MYFKTTLTLARDTKRTVRYESSMDSPLVNNGQPGTLYIPKTALPTPYPKKIEVTIEAVEEEVEVANNL